MKLKRLHPKPYYLNITYERRIIKTTRALRQQPHHPKDPSTTLFQYNAHCLPHLKNTHQFYAIIH